MKKIILYSFLCLVCLTSCQQCKKKEKEKVTITGTIYTDCNNIASNKTYYLVWYPWKKVTPIELKTDANGMFSYEVDKYLDAGYNISTNTNINNSFGGFRSKGETKNVGIIRESVSNQLVLKLKTNHVISNLDTIKYAFQYSGIVNLVNGTITKDTIIGIYNQNIAPNLYNDNPANGELKTLWWNLNKTSVGTSDNQVDYTIHGCAGVADTAYIVVP